MLKRFLLVFCLFLGCKEEVETQTLDWPVKSVSELKGAFLTREGIMVNGNLYPLPAKPIQGQINLPFSWFFINGEKGIQGFYDSNRVTDDTFNLTLYNYKNGTIENTIWVSDYAEYYSIYRDMLNFNGFQRITQYSKSLDFEGVVFDLGDLYHKEEHRFGSFLQVNEDEVIALLKDRENQPPDARLVSINLETREITTILNHVHYRSLFIENEDKVYFLKDNTIQYYSLSTKEITEEYTFEEGGIFMYKKDSEGNYYIQFTRGERGPFSTLPTPYWCMITPSGEKYLIDGLPFYDSNDPLYFEGIR